MENDFDRYLEMALKGNWVGPAQKASEEALRKAYEDYEAFEVIIDGVPYGKGTRHG